MVAYRKKFSSQASPELLEAVRKVARERGISFRAALEDAMREYVESRDQSKVRPEVMAHYRASLEKNRRLAELLAQ